MTALLKSGYVPDGHAHRYIGIAFALRALVVNGLLLPLSTSLREGVFSEIYLQA